MNRWDVFALVCHFGKFHEHIVSRNTNIIKESICILIFNKKEANVTHVNLHPLSVVAKPPYALGPISPTRTPLQGFKSTMRILYYYHPY